MELKEYRFHLLHSRKDLLEETATLVNQEWPRSMAARLASIEDGCDELPCSIVMTEELSGSARVVGHARLMPVAGYKDAALIETVIVLPKLRGRGLGRLIMNEAESHSIKMGYKSLHLSTHDKQGFYSRLGYVEGMAVSGRRKCVANLTEDQAHSILGAESKVNTTTDLVNVLYQQPAPPPPLASLAPPPPPPPKLLETSKTVSSEIVTWMMKQLST